MSNKYIDPIIYPKKPDFFAILCLFTGFVLGMVACAINMSIERPIKGMAIIHPVFDAPELSIVGVPTDSLVKAQIIACGIEHPDIAIRQYKWETGHLTPSSIGCRNNNLFCLKRDTTMYFESWQESVWYYKIWQRHLTKYRGSTKEDYLSHLEKYWKAEDSNYVKKIMQ